VLLPLRLVLAAAKPGSPIPMMPDYLVHKCGIAGGTD
jgi:hypothetical protein